MTGPRKSDIKVREVRVPLVDAAILAVASKVSLQSDFSLNEEDEAVLAALRRAHPSAGDTNEDLGRWLSQMDNIQISGVVSNTKGVLHEMRFVEMENADGDTIYAAQFAATNHAGYDVVFSDSASGAEWVTQLKATSSEAYVREWLEKHPDGEILVTCELAEQMGLKSSGITNEDLTIDTERLIDRLVSAEHGDAIWNYVPGLTALSIAVVVYRLHERLKKGEIARDEFARMVAKTTGKSSARVVLLAGLLSIPVVNIATGLALISNFLNSAGIVERWNTYLDKKLALMEAIAPFESAVYTERLSIEHAMKSAERELQTDLMLSKQDDAYRQKFLERVREFSAILNEHRSPTDEPIFEYVDPDSVVPPEHPRGEVEDTIREKVNEIQNERRELFQRARSFLKDERLHPYFLRSLQGCVGSSGVKGLTAATVAQL